MSALAAATGTAETPFAAQCEASQSGGKAVTPIPCGTPTLETQIRETETMKLRDLSKPQWDAALEAARILMSGSPNREADRAAFRDATDRFAALLPPEADMKGLVLDAARWDATNFIAAVCAGIPTEEAA